MARGIPFSEETLTAGAVASGPTPSVFRPGGFSNRIPIQAIMEVKDAGIFYSLHSSSATPDSDDHDGPVGTVVEITDVARLRWIRSGASDAKVKLSYFLT